MANRYLNTAEEPTATKVDRLRSMGWPHVLDLMQRGIEEDAAVCESEQWPETAAALVRMANAVGQLGDAYRAAVYAAEERDKQAGRQ